MSEPKKKRSHSRQGKRRSHQALGNPSLMLCPNCKSPKLSHRVCPTCGMYDGRQAVVVTTESKKK
ncbi:MAG: 50S ribosomal protein L32 [Dehalococcoidia bacterium]|nr:50S ribosomal protein L32 [Dehalococcoidia bacterium]